MTGVKEAGAASAAAERGKELGIHVDGGRGGKEVVVVVEVWMEMLRRKLTAGGCGGVSGGGKSCWMI